MRRNYLFILFISIFLISCNIYSQNDPDYYKLKPGIDSSSFKFNKLSFTKHQKPFLLDQEKSNVNYIKFASLTGFTIGAVFVLHNMQKHAWWSGQRGTFHIQNDWAYALSMDKVAHFMEGGLISKTMKGAFIWSGVSEKTAIWLGALFSIAYMTDIEIEDGFATDWGYSPGDEIANLTGDIFSVAQDLWTPLQTVKIKWSYVPTGDPNHKGDFPDDYSGQVFWLSFDINNYFGKKFEKHWPDFLNFDIGYGVQKYQDFGPDGRIQNFYMGLDIDLRKVIPGNSAFMKFIKEFLNTFKIIPTPQIKWNMKTGKVNFVIR